MSVDSMGRVGGTGSMNIEDETDMLPSFGDEAVGPPVNENGLVEDGRGCGLAYRRSVAGHSTTDTECRAKGMVLSSVPRVWLKGGGFCT